MDAQVSIRNGIKKVKEAYWPLIKGRQTFLLLITGAAGYLCQRSLPVDWLRLAGLLVSLFFAISGCTVLNMVIDRDIDRKMERTSRRPLAAERVDERSATLLGSILLGLGLSLSLVFSLRYCLLVLAGAGLDLVVYSLWLKRRSAWSILWGGFSGGMPLLAGSVLATGKVSMPALLAALAVVGWIPSHNLTFGLLYSTEYLNAGIPTFANVYGKGITRLAVLVSSLLTSGLMGAAFLFLGFSIPILAALAAACIILISMALFDMLSPSTRAALTLYKYSSIFMLAVMLLLILRQSG